ncbi:MAG: aspartate/glutamate racemase family protein [Candidatus Aminicenantales bacterium]
MKIRAISCLSTLSLMCIAMAVLIWPDSAGAQRSGAGLEKLFQKSRVTVAVTDSGLGGLSVMAEAARRMKESGIFKRADFIFFNSLFSAGGGYNSLKTREEKIRVFDSALRSLEEKYRPDIILIGCNTLSVLYEDTPFLKTTKLPVIGIVDAGVELISRGLRDHPEAEVIIFGTPTTISEGAYARELEKRGFAPERIYSQSCPELESFIERDHRGEETAMLVAGCVGEALQNIEKSGDSLPPLIISLNCTHYGYALPLWENAFEESGVKPLEILNPNSRMTDPLFEKRYGGRHKKTKITAKVVSMVEISPSKIESLGGWLQDLSPEVAGALSHYKHIAGLFEWEKFISR